MGTLAIVHDAAVAFVILAASRAVKFAGQATARPALGDGLWAAALAAGAALAELAGGPAGRALADIAVLAVLATVWIGAAVWRVFTVEVGRLAFDGMAQSRSFREPAEVDWVRNWTIAFYRDNPGFALLPLPAIGWLVVPFLPLHVHGAARVAVVAVLVAWLATTSARTRASCWLGCALAAALAPAAPTPPPQWWHLVVVLVLLPAGRLLRRRGLLRGSIAGDCLLPRPWPAPPRTGPPACTAADGWQARPPRRSPYAGALRGHDVLLITLESVGRDHLARFTPDGARTPFLDALYAHAVVSPRHVAPSPLTTNAHVLLAHGRYRADGESQVHRLNAAGYRTAYLTSARTSYYGLSDILAEAGYQTLIDRSRLGGHITDRELPAAGADALLAGLPAGRAPLFLHVHTTDTHVPYRVRDPRFRRRGDGRRDRFLDAVEEADDNLRRLYEALTERGVLRDPLIVVTADHGESFGRLGYHFHATAVTAEQTLVPLAVAHPALPAAQVSWSSHLDVLPTVLDLTGVPAAPSHGESLFHPDRTQRLALWVGHPMRRSTSCYGLIDGERKLMVDLVTERCFESDWEDRSPRSLHGPERRHAAQSATTALRRLGLD
ncbi:sulfatase-like hydrolase/transferase [Nonomuraea wenchangensis]